MIKDCSRMEMASLLRNMILGKVPVEVRETMPKSFQGLFSKGKKEEIGLTMSNIVWLGNQMDSANYTEPALKNWVKREIKEYIGPPQVGRKYSIQQVAILFIVKDLKVLLDFDAIRNVLGSVFNNPVNREDDIISPVQFYAAYATAYDKLISKGLLSEEPIKEEITKFLATKTEFMEEEKIKISRAMMVSILAVRTNYLKAWANRYVMGERGKE
ncbi:hypothetical protein FIU87_20335 [Bacillus sp. THAF10]|uniref:DUF1836 domain-containing protein n=1 Tax=Bacillus sp. THAF10 TaxID=2587848 RepID=UPI0012681EC1|nr:DUF1836 domain-containing protein [Bacillus sp. THAF10]QFT91001.1 hypothetical protein FIU87_20335 [Bacillus sp. THAF10]